MADWNNWEKKKKELKDYLKRAENEIENMNIIEARDILTEVVVDMNIVIDLANQ